MKFHLQCHLCAENATSFQESLVLAPVNDSSIHKLTCKQGHTTTVVVTEPRYQQLFEIGLSAILDDYPREAVVSFAASLERFYQFSFEVLACKANIGQVQATAAWALISKQSERQLGAFVAAWLLAQGEPPKLLTSSQTSFRNKVVHNGMIPTRSQAMEFGDWVLQIITPISKVLRSKYSKSYWEYSSRLSSEVMKSPELTGQQISRHSLAMALRDIELVPNEDNNIAYYCERMMQFREFASA